MELQHFAAVGPYLEVAAADRQLQCGLTPQGPVFGGQQLFSFVERDRLPVKVGLRQIIGCTVRITAHHTHGPLPGAEGGRDPVFLPRRVARGHHGCTSVRRQGRLAIPGKGVLRCLPPGEPLAEAVKEKCAYRRTLHHLCLPCYRGDTDVVQQSIVVRLVVDVAAHADLAGSICIVVNLQNGIPIHIARDGRAVEVNAIGKIRILGLFVASLGQHGEYVVHSLIKPHQLFIVGVLEQIEVAGILVAEQQARRVPFSAAGHTYVGCHLVVLPAAVSCRQNPVSAGCQPGIT